MKNKLLLICAIIFTQLQGDMMFNGKPQINFYTKGKLMWLIDTTPMNREYKMLTINEYVSIYNASENELKRSFETYLNHANTDPKYKYKDWRLPTIQELKTLEYKGGWLRRIFTSSKHVKDDISIDKEIFYDINYNSDASYWASDEGKLSKDGKKRFGNVYFAYKRFKDYYYHSGYNGRGGSGYISIPSIKHTGGEGIRFGFGKYTSERHIRLVRDIKDN